MLLLQRILFRQLPLDARPIAPELRIFRAQAGLIRRLPLLRFVGIDALVQKLELLIQAIDFSRKKSTHSSPG